MNEDVVTGWTIYHRPSDFPNHYATRQWFVTDDGLQMHPFACVCESLEEARECIPPNAIWFDREDDDDPVIVESWL